MGIEWRAITHDDVPAWNSLLAAAEAVDRTEEHYDEGDLHEELDDPGTSPLDRVGAWAGGEMVAFAGVQPREAITSYWRIDAEGTVHPRQRGAGLGSTGVAWIVERAAALQQERHPEVEAKVHLGGVLDNDSQVALLETSGFVPVNWSAVMRTDLAGMIRPKTRLPDGLRLAAYDVGWSTRTREAHNAAFQDHWGFVPWTATMWKQWEDDGRNARHALSWLVLPDGRDDLVAGYCLTHEYEAYAAATGQREAYLAKIGVRREFRGRGIASWLLDHALRSYAEAGFDNSSLDVDTNNPTGAFGLYERAGYVVERRTATYERSLPAREAGG